MSLPGLSSLLPLPVAVPLAVAAFCPIASRIWRRLPLVACLLALGASSAILLAMAPTVYGGHLLAHFMGHVLPVHGKALGIAFAADPWGLSFALVSSLVGMVILVYAVSELRGLGAKEEGWFACLFLLLDAALIGSALTADVINLFVWFEVAALASYALTGFFLERPIALEASFKVLVLTNIASFAIFIGATLLYAATGGLDFGQLQQALAHHVTRPELVALALLVGGFATKAGLLPFHGWLPDAHTAAPGSVSALFSGLMVNLGIVAIGRIVFEVFLPAGGKPVLGLLMVLGTASAVFGAVFALFQDDLKRLLAYDTISQMGVLAVGLATGSAGGVAGAEYHLWNHALFKSLLFLCAGAILHNTGATNLSEMGGARPAVPAPCRRLLGRGALDRRRASLQRLRLGRADPRCAARQGRVGAVRLHGGGPDCHHRCSRKGGMDGVLPAGPSRSRGQPRRQGSRPRAGRRSSATRGTSRSGRG